MDLSHPNLPSVKNALLKVGMQDDDFAWLDSFGWSASKVPAPTARELTDYKRRELLLNESILDLGIVERGASLQGQLAAAIGAHLANLRDPDDDEGYQ
jgi:hypothetical protein